MTRDSRLSLNGTALSLQDTQEEDAGPYTCEISTQPPRTVNHTLELRGAPTGPGGASSLPPPPHVHLHFHFSHIILLQLLFPRFRKFHGATLMDIDFYLYIQCFLILTSMGDAQRPTDTLFTKTLMSLGFT